MISFFPESMTYILLCTGGILFDCGGFPLPFIISGGLLVFCALAAAVVLDPSEELRQTREDEGEGETRDVRGGGKQRKGSLFCSLPVILGLLSTILTGAANQWCVNTWTLTLFKKDLHQVPA